MQAITTIGFDIAKSVFQVHGVDAAGQVVIRRQLKRRYVLMPVFCSAQLHRPMARCVLPVLVGPSASSPRSLVALGPGSLRGSRAAGTSRPPR
jgi:hypothetical protein